jgi:hydrogenase maturation factor
MVRSGDHQHRVNLSLLKNVKVGDYLLIHEGLAINKVPKAEAERILKIIQTHSHQPKTSNQ